MAAIFFITRNLENRQILRENEEDSHREMAEDCYIGNQKNQN